MCQKLSTCRRTESRGLARSPRFKLNSVTPRLKLDDRVRKPRQEGRKDGGRKGGRLALNGKRGGTPTKRERRTRGSPHHMRRLTPTGCFISAFASLGTSAETELFSRSSEFWQKGTLAAKVDRLLTLRRIDRLHVLLYRQLPTTICTPNEAVTE